MSEMLEVVIDSVRVSLMSTHRVILLRQKDAERFLPIWVGPAEAEAITVALQEVELARPMTHDLLKNMLTLFNARLLRIEINAIREDIFYASLVLERDGALLTMDSRPSDAIALAVRVHAPLLVDRAVMQDAGIVPEQDIQAEASLEEPLQDHPLPAEPAAEDDQRLDVFEDFLKKLGGTASGEDEPDQP